jgi:hypothetical protein
VSNWAQYYDEIVDRHGPVLTAAVGRRLAGVWTLSHGLGRRSAHAWASHAPILFAFEGLKVEFAWNRESRSVARVEVDRAQPVERHGEPVSWYSLGDDPEAPAELTALVGQRLWAVDLLEVDGVQLDLGFAFSRSYLTLTSACCCTQILACGPRQRRTIRLAQTGPTKEGFPPRTVIAPRGRPAWPPSRVDPSLVRPGRPDDQGRATVQRQSSLA